MHKFCWTPTLSMTLNVLGAGTTHVSLKSLCKKRHHIISVRPSCNLKRSQYDFSCKVKKKKKSPFWKQIFSPSEIWIWGFNCSSLTQWKFLSHSHNASTEASFNVVILRPVSFQLVVSPSLRTWSSLLMLLLPASSGEEGKSVADPVGGFCGPDLKRHTSLPPFFHWPEVTAKLNSRKAKIRALATCQRKGKLSQWKTHQYLSDTPYVSSVAILTEENASVY